MREHFKKIFFGMMILFLGSCQQPTDKFCVPYYDEKTDLYGLKDQSGNILWYPQYEYIDRGSEYRWSAESNINRIKLFHSSYPDTQYLVTVKKDGEFFRISQDKKINLKSVFFDNLSDYFEDGLARFIGTEGSEKDLVGFHNRRGEIIVKPRYDYASPFRNGYAFVCKGCWGEYPKLKKYRPLSSSSCNTPMTENNLYHGYFF